jgi:hypothetical protein
MPGDASPAEKIPAFVAPVSSKTLKLLHFNDVYNIEARAQEPCGGAARFVTKVKLTIFPCSRLPSIWCSLVFEQ